MARVRTRCTRTSLALTLAATPPNLDSACRCRVIVKLASRMWTPVYRMKGKSTQAGEGKVYEPPFYSTSPRNRGKETGSHATTLRCQQGSMNKDWITLTRAWKPTWQ
eukprot:358299-Chlamydomonas_euryale.AAC.11